MTIRRIDPSAILGGGNGDPITMLLGGGPGGMGGGDPLAVIQRLLGGAGEANSIFAHNFEGTFDSFQIYNPDQRPVVDLLVRVTERLAHYGRDFQEGVNPLREGKMLGLVSPSGYGKTHLMHSVINLLKAYRPDVLQHAYYQSPLFSSGRGISVKQTPIIFVDDLYAEDRTVSCVERLPEEAVVRFMNLAADIYDNHGLLIYTANFPIRDPMFARIDEIDRIGRHKSRMGGLAEASKEIRLAGEDYRRQAARNHRADSRRDFEI